MKKIIFFIAIIFISIFNNAQTVICVSDAYKTYNMNIETQERTPASETIKENTIFIFSDSLMTVARESGLFTGIYAYTYIKHLYKDSTYIEAIFCRVKSSTNKIYDVAINYTTNETPDVKLFTEENNKFVQVITYRITRLTFVYKYDEDKDKIIEQNLTGEKLSFNN